MKSILTKVNLCYFVIAGSIALIIPNAITKNFYGCIAYVFLIVAMILTIRDIKKTNAKNDDVTSND